MADSTITLSNLTASGGIGQIVLSWSIGEPNTCLTYLAIGRVEVWASQTNDRTTATKVGESTGVAHAHTGLTAAATWYYWVKARDASDNYSDWFPASSTAGVSGTTLKVGAGLIEAGAVGTTELADDAVTTDKIGNGAVTQAQLALLAVNAANIQNNAVTVDKIVNAAVTEAKLGTGAVTTGKVAAGAIVTVNLAAGAVVAEKIAAGSIIATHLAVGSVTANAILANAITADKIGAGQVTATKLAAGSVTTGAILAGQIISTHLSANSITAGKLAADSIHTPALFVDGVMITTKMASNSTSRSEIYSNNGAINVSNGLGNVEVARKAASADGKTGERVHVQFNASIYAAFNGSSNWGSFQANLYKNGSPVAGANCVARPDDENQDGLFVINHTEVSPGAGSATWTVNVQYISSPGPGANINVRNRFLKGADAMI